MTPEDSTDPCRIAQFLLEQSTGKGGLWHDEAEFMLSMRVLARAYRALSTHAEKAEHDLTMALDGISYYAALGVCACESGCECGHCKARRIIEWIKTHPGMNLVNSMQSNNKFLSTEWARHTKFIHQLRAEVRALREALEMISAMLPTGNDAEAYKTARAALQSRVPKGAVDAPKANG